MIEHEERQTLRARVQHYPGLGSHIYVTLKPDTIVGDVPAERTMKFRNRSAAVRWVNHVYHREFSEETYHLVWDEEEMRRWFYSEGD